MRIQPMLFVLAGMICITSSLTAMKFSKLTPKNKNIVNLFKKNVRNGTAESNTEKYINKWNNIVIGGLVITWIAGNTALSYTVGHHTGVGDVLQKKIDTTRDYFERHSLEWDMLRHDRKIDFPTYWGFASMSVLSEAVLCVFLSRTFYPRGAYTALQAAFFGLGYVRGRLVER